MSNFTITENAKIRIEQILKSKHSNNNPQKQKVKLYVRLEVLGGGCSGLKYNFSITDQKEKNDFSFEHDSTSLLIDEDSLSLLEGARLNYKSELIGSAFEIENPNSVSSCGCGMSFSI